MYDYVIIDTPPLGSVVDALIIAKECDGVALVVEANETSYKFARKIKDQIERNDIKFLGVILNKVTIGKKRYVYGKYYSSYYSNYEQYENSENDTE